MDDTERNKMMFDWIKAEYELVNKQIGAWSEADQKIIVVMATIVVATIGLASSLYAQRGTSSPSYMLFLAAIIMSLAAAQSSLYSSLILLALERKVELSKRMASFLHCDADFVMTRYAPDKTGPLKSYIVGVVPYFAIRCSSPLALSLAGLFFLAPELYSTRLFVCAGLSLAFSLTSVYITMNHAQAFLGFQKSLGPRPQLPAADRTDR